MKSFVVNLFSRIRNRAIAATIFNVVCFISGKEVRVKWDSGSFILPNKFRYLWPGRSFQYINGTLGRAEKLQDDYLLKHIKFQNGDRVIDCGANIGELLLCLESRVCSITYLAFEPGPQEYELLEKNARLFNKFIVELQPVALSDRIGRTNFFVKSETADSSIFPVDGAQTELEVDTVLLSDFLGERTKFLKLEAEGAEPEILRGAGDNIRKVEYVACDCGPERGLAQQHTIAECVTLLTEKDFELVDVCLSRFVFLFKNKKMRCK